jgi:hypothetical protein
MVIIILSVMSSHSLKDFYIPFSLFLKASLTHVSFDSLYRLYPLVFLRKSSYLVTHVSDYSEGGYHEDDIFQSSKTATEVELT